MKYSKLKHDMEILELNQKHELEITKLRHNMEMNELLKKCTHSYEDGTSARTFAGTQWDNFYECEICGKSL